jgi:hypothetical protein
MKHNGKYEIWACPVSMVLIIDFRILRCTLDLYWYNFDIQILSFCWHYCVVLSLTDGTWTRFRRRAAWLIQKSHRSVSRMLCDGNETRKSSSSYGRNYMLGRWRRRRGLHVGSRRGRWPQWLPSSYGNVRGGGGGGAGVRPVGMRR